MPNTKLTEKKATTGVKTTKMTTSPAHTAKALSHELIAQRAYKIWLEKGRPMGRDMEHWFQAEQELKLAK